jgi:cell division protein FtsI (penicillin-binding protein 3)
VAAAVFLLWSIGIEARLVYLQVYRHDDLSSRAERQQSRTVEAAAKRGEITDRRGRVLAYSVDADSIYAVPTEISDADAAAVALCGALDDCTSKDRQALAERIRRGRAFVYVRRQATPDQARRVAALDLEGVGFMKESRRFYPNKELGAHVLGYVGLDNSGLGGIEATYDNIIKGRAGTVLIQTDARRHAFSRIEKPPTAGASLELTIDQYLQYVAERELQRGVEENRAKGGTAIVMDPSTGEILALANYPTFNPNAFGEFRPDERRNRGIQDLYEPGSTFKLVTASAALEQGIVRPEDMVDVSGGRYSFGSSVVRDTHDYGTLSFTDVIVKSSNVGAIKVGLRLGPERMMEYVKRFGFGRRSSPDFPGETRGIVWEASKLKDRGLGSVSMGYQIGVTPLQMAAAVSSVANGGELFEPRVVRAVVRDGRRLPVPHKLVNRTITPEVAAAMTTMMEAVVERGTATMAQIPGYTIAGKTGTAAKLVDGRYSRSDYNGSFIGFLPSRKPAFTIVVVIDAAHGPNGYYGGPVAGPIFRRIAEAALRYRGIGPSINAAPPILVARRDEQPEQPAVARMADKTIYPLANATSGAGALFPDLRGLGAREALRALGQLGVTARIHGDGLVVRQEPAPGTPLDRGGASTLWLQRRPLPREELSSAAAHLPPDATRASDNRP